MTSNEQKSKLFDSASYVLLIPLNICISVIFFLGLRPIGFLPSDDMAYVEIIDKTVACLQVGFNCFPPPSGFYTKPFFELICGIFQFYIGKYLGFTSLESMVFVGSIAMALSAAILQRQLICVSPSKIWGLVVGLILFWTSYTVLGDQLWWGYGQFVAFLVFLGMELTLRYCVMIEKVLHQLHCEFSLNAREFCFSNIPPPL